jgi:hypothetical protein
MACDKEGEIMGRFWYGFFAGLFMGTFVAIWILAICQMGREEINKRKSRKILPEKEEIACNTATYKLR